MATFTKQLVGDIMGSIIGAIGTIDLGDNVIGTPNNGPMYKIPQ